jgi:BNR repeat-like domain
MRTSGSWGERLAKLSRNTGMQDPQDHSSGRRRGAWLSAVVALVALSPISNAGLPAVGAQNPSGTVGRPRNLNLTPNGIFSGEPTLAVNPANPKNLVAAWMQRVAPGQLEIKVTSSFDRGISWGSPTLLGHIDPIYTTSADVSVAFDNNGRAHLTFVDIEPDPSGTKDCEFQIASAEVVHRRSDDGGVTWSKAVRVRHSGDTPDFAIDRPWVAVDRSGGPYDGRVYVVTISFYCNNPSPPAHVRLKWSTDGGVTWSADVQVDNAQFSTGPLPGLPFPAVVDVGGDGKLWIAYPSAGSPACPAGTCLLSAMSSDGGQTFTRSKITDVTPASARGFLLFQTLAADKAQPGVCSVAWPDGGLDPLGSDLLLARSVDGGGTWSAPVRVNDNPQGLGVGVDQPWMAAGTDGSLALLWRDRRAAGPGSNVPFEIFVAYSPDGGATFLPNQKLSTQPSPFNPLPCCNSFQGLVLSGGWLHGDWGDFREGQWKVFYGRVRVGSGQ